MSIRITDGPEDSHTSGPIADLDWNVLSQHQFQGTRPWPDGTRANAPNWNPGCTCGHSHYSFQHTRHLAEVIYAAGYRLNRTSTTDPPPREIE
jgi:hypothetical protein